jgi:hypothetical protein
MELLDASVDPFNMGWNLPEGHLTLEDEVLLAKYAKGVCVNLGTFKGRSAVIMSYYADKVITIDCYKAPEFGHDYVVEQLKKYSNIEPIEAISSYYAPHLNDDSIDTLVIDAGHAKQDVVDDYNAYYPKLKSGAIVMFHDYKYMDGSGCKSMDVVGGVTEVMKLGTLKHLKTAGWFYIAQKI